MQTHVSYVVDSDLEKLSQDKHTGIKQVYILGCVRVYGMFDYVFLKWRIGKLERGDCRIVGHLCMSICLLSTV